MTKKFLCIQGSPEIPKGTIATWRQDTGEYHLSPPYLHITLEMEQVEGNECWEEVKEETKEEDKPTRWKPKMGQPFYCLDESGFVDIDEWDGTLGDQRKWDIGNCFQTEQEARDEVKRRESIANAWIPKDGEECWMWDFTAGGVVYARTTPVPYIYIGAIHPTEEACQIWGENYAHVFLPKTI